MASSQSSSKSMPEASDEHAQKVAHHYNKLEERGLESRSESRIYYLRNLNNFIKSALIRDVLDKVFEEDRYKKVHVLDLCSGKGGDLLKWKKGNIHHLVCTDIAETSVQQSEIRYREGANRGRDGGHRGYNNYNQQKFSAEFIVADCTRARLKNMYQNPNQKFDVVSSQFSFHYCFESYKQAIGMLRNACECLKVGGYFVGTTPNANEIVNRLRNSENKQSFGNDVYSITFPNQEDKQFPIFGAKYNFHLEGVVDCPEFLVYFPVFEKLAAEFGMKLVHKKTFSQYFKDSIQQPDNAMLLQNMSALEPYPGSEHRPLVSKDEGDYTFAKEFLSKKKESQSGDQHNQSPYVGTLSKAEWEAATIYLVFMFQKVEDKSPPLE